MNYENLEPKKVFKFFKELTEIPHGSYNEKAISDYLVNFAKERNLEVIQDENLNVIIKKPGTSGYENSETVILQGHMDMVCEKSKDSTHDFTKDPLKLQIKENSLYATDTTLGADDGIAVAYALTILDSEDIPHPPLEIVVTTAEETGMDGAMALDTSLLSGKKLLNIDGEEDGVFLTGCAGGITTKVSFTIEKWHLSGQYIELEISGLLGGHSGVEIIKQRANANKLMARVLYAINQNFDLNLVQINGGSKHNAIPSHALVGFTIKNSKTSLTLEEICSNCLNRFKEEFRVSDPNINVIIHRDRTTELTREFTSSLTNNIVGFLLASPDGVQTMSNDIKGLVESSLNLAVIEKTSSTVDIFLSIRSSVHSLKFEIFDRISVLANLCQAKCENIGEYPEWEYSPSSQLRDLSISTFKNLFNQTPKVTVIHAGLECGLFKESMIDTDMISFGPNIIDPHTPNEHLDLASAKRYWEFLLELLKNLK